MSIPRARWLAVALIAVLLLAGGSYSFLAAHNLEAAVLSSVQSAQRHLERGKGDLKRANAKHDVGALDAAQAEFRAGIDDFRRAARTADGDRTAQDAAGAPLVGQAVRSRLLAVDALCDMGIALSQAALRSADVDRLFVVPSPGSAQGGAARILSILTAAAPIMPEVKELLGKAQAAAARIDPGLLSSSQRDLLASVKGTISKGLSGVEEFNRLAPVIQEVLGAKGPRTYLVEQVNPFELRAGGGYIGTYSLIQADDGQLRVIESGDTHDLPEYGLTDAQRGYVSPPATMTEFLDDKSWNLGDSNFFPTFPSNAQAALSTFGERDFGTKLDGVIALDLYAVKGILQLTGPIQVDGSGTTLDAQNLFPTLIQLDIADPNHKEVLGALAGPLMSKVTGLNAAKWPQLLDTLNSLAGQRHIQAYFTDQGVEQEFARLGWAGDAAWSGTKDFMYPLESNFGGNKANYYLKRHYTIDLTRSGSILHHKIQIDYNLDLSSAPAQFTKGWTYRTYVRTFLPEGATGAAMSGVKGDDYPYTNDPPGAIPAGTRVVDGWQQINVNSRTRKGSMRIVVEYDTPWTTDGSGRHELYWQSQPGTSGDLVTVHWTDGGRTVTENGALNGDIVLMLGPGKVDGKPGHVAQAQIPKLSF